MIDNSKEYIVCAAIWYKNGKPLTFNPKNITEGIVICGLRHWVFEILIRLHPDYKQDECTIQGFLTSNNRFVDREEASQIALGANQVIEDQIESVRKCKCLFSEDIY